MTALPIVLSLLSWLFVQPQTDSDARLDSVIQAEVTRGFSGVVLVARGEAIVLERAYGSARGLDTSSRFWIASAGKQFTSAAILSCMEKGWLTLDDPITRYFPDAPTDKRAVTVRQLLAHTSGFAQSYVSEDLSDRSDAVARMLAEPLAAAPGERFVYSNNNYQLVVAIVEVASGRPYRQYVRDELWNRAGLSRTGFAGESGAAYTAPVPAGLPERLTRASWGGEGVFSTAHDLLMWYRALQRGTVLSLPSVETLFAPVAPIKEGSTALGWFVGQTPRGSTTVFTRGNEGFGANALVYAYPQSDTVIIVLTHAGATSDGTSWSRHLLAKIEACLEL